MVGLYDSPRSSTEDFSKHVDLASPPYKRPPWHAAILSFLKILYRSHHSKLIHDKPKTADEGDLEAQSVLHPHESLPPFCIFCGVSGERGFNIVHEDDDYIAFSDINPSSKLHIQLIPKKHIESVKTLRPGDAVMVKEMLEIGHRILERRSVPPYLRRLGFHIPPYISVPHLHMHVQALPYRSLLRRLKYPVVSGIMGNTKGFSWFADTEQILHLLEKGVQVRILPC